MKTVRTAKRIIKKFTTPHMRESMNEVVFRMYQRVLLPEKRKRDIASPFGVNLVGHIQSDCGLGESCRLVASGLKASDVPFCVIDVPQYGLLPETNRSWSAYRSGTFRYHFNLIHLNAGELARNLGSLKPAALKNGYNIAYWLWELPEFPPAWDYTFSIFDEIWTPSVFVSEAIRKRTDKPVLTMPYGLSKPLTCQNIDRQFFGLPENEFLVFVSYDGSSISERKNPVGAIEAFRTAFPAGEARLVIKATNDDKLDEMTEGIHKVTILRESYKKETFNSLLQTMDVYLSLHRAEGFGLVMAEAMLLGVPVVATNWSANTEFMCPGNSCLVDAKIVELDKDIPPYEKGNHWADPDIWQAAAYLRRLYEDRKYGLELSINAYESLQARSVGAAGKMMESRLNEIWIN